MHVEIPFPLEAMIEDLGTKLSRKVKESHCLGSNQWNNHFQSLWEHIGTVQTEDHILKFIADKDIKSGKSILCLCSRWATSSAEQLLKDTVP